MKLVSSLWLVVLTYNGFAQPDTTLPGQQRRISTFDFSERIEIRMGSGIGERLKLDTTYKCVNTFDFTNVSKLEYTGSEAEIIEKIDPSMVHIDDHPFSPFSGRKNMELTEEDKRKLRELLDQLPEIETKEKSTITSAEEFSKLIPIDTTQQK